MLRRRGFTLIELVLVCSILAILTSVVIASYGYYSQRAERLKGLSGGTQVYNAFMWYYRENKNNLTSVMATSYMEKAISYDITNVIINNKEKLSVDIKYIYEGSNYLVEIQPETSEYFLWDEGNSLIYP